MRHLVDIVDLSTAEINELIDKAMDIADNSQKYSNVLRGKKLATLFYEPSTRTRLSFESAMLDLGGSVLSCADMGNSSATKGETIADTVRVVSNYADIIAMRHSYEGSALVATQYADVPVVNAGDGGHCHPTQTLADLLTIKREIGRLENLTIGVCGDLKYGRTVHSLINAMSRYEGIKFILIAPEILQLPQYMYEVMQNSGVEYKNCDSLESALPQLDILYMTRVQRERFDDKAQYESVKDCFVLTAEKMRLAKKKMAVLHPLPRVNEIDTLVDNDCRSAYFRQTFNGKLMRMALILMLLEQKNLTAISKVQQGKYIERKTCANKKCVTNNENIPAVFVTTSDGKNFKCLYCDSNLID